MNYLALISDKIIKHIAPLFFKNNTSIFLIGAGFKTGSQTRELLKKKLQEMRKYKINIDIHYPEDIFDELMFSEEKLDLLRLENLLAESVNAVVIILESAGAIAELGAFANHDKLQNKLIVIVDDEYKNDKSFIRLGPLKFLSNHTKSKVLYFSPKLLQKKIPNIRAEIFNAAKRNRTEPIIDNIIFFQFYLLVLIFAIEPIDYNSLFEIANNISNDKEKTRIILGSALQILLKNKNITLKNGQYSFTKNGYLNFCSTLDSIGLKGDVFRLMDNFRINVLNNHLRGIPLGGGAI